MPNPRSIGYIGVDVFNNATICNESVALIDAGVPLDIVSLHRFDKPTYYEDATLAALRGRVHTLYPMGFFPTLWALACAPWIFGTRFWIAVGKMMTSPYEGWRQHMRLFYHFIPALCVAMYWRKRNLGHIHAHWAHTATTIAMHAAELLGIGFSFTGHANDLFVHRVALKAKLRRARFVVCISEFHRQFYLNLGADPARLQVVYCGIDTQRFVPRGPDQPVTDVSTARILGVGRLVEKKGFHHLIEACAELRDRGLDFECMIAGSGPEEGMLRQLTEQLHVADCVTITGKAVLQEELQPLLQTATVFALPCVRDRDGDMDGLPQVLIEAMACNVPVVSTRLVGIPDLIHDEWNGLLVSPRNVMALADALEQILSNPEWASTLACNGMDWARLHFGRDKTIQRLQQLFTWAASTPGRDAGEQCWQCAHSDDGDITYFMEQETGIHEFTIRLIPEPQSMAGVSQE